MNLSAIAIKRPVFTVMVTVALLVLGARRPLAARHRPLPRRLLPRRRRSTSSTRARARREVENLVSKPLEDAVVSLNGIDRVMTHVARGALDHDHLLQARRRHPGGRDAGARARRADALQAPGGGEGAGRHAASTSARRPCSSTRCAAQGSLSRDPQVRATTCSGRRSSRSTASPRSTSRAAPSARSTSTSTSREDRRARPLARGDRRRAPRRQPHRPRRPLRRGDARDQRPHRRRARRRVEADPRARRRHREGRLERAPLRRRQRRGRLRGAAHAHPRRTATRPSRSRSSSSRAATRSPSPTPCRRSSPSSRRPSPPG